MPGGIGFRLRRQPDTTVTLDAAYVGATAWATVVRESVIADAMPLHAVDVLSPQDDWELTVGHATACCEAGVAMTWVVEPVFQSVTVYAPTPRRRCST